MAGDQLSDSSGVPWEGRTFLDNPHAGDSGETPADVAECLTAWRAGTGSFTDLVAAFAANRFLIPLVTRAGDDFDVDHPVMEDKVQELSVITVAGPSGEKVIPAFTSVAAMSVWNSDARPIPIETQRVALAAASEQTDRIVVNPGTDSIVLRRPIVWSIAQGNPYNAPWESDEFDAESIVPPSSAKDVPARRAAADGEVSEDEGLAVEGETTVQMGVSTDSAVPEDEELGTTLNLVDIAFAPGDPSATGDGPDVTLVLGLVDGLDANQVQTLTTEVQARVSGNELFANQVDALTLTLSMRAE